MTSGPAAAAIPDRASAPIVSIALTEKVFGGDAVLRDVSFAVEAGETLAIIGPSGIGKTTLLRILAGLDGDFRGRVRCPDKIALVFQEPTLLPWRSAIQNIILATNVSEHAAKAILSEVGLAGLGDRLPGQLSLGQRRRLSLARAFAADPDLLLMDEPFVSLDPARVHDLLALTRTLLAKREIATLFVTHSESEAAALATRTIRLDGSPATIVDRT